MHRPAPLLSALLLCAALLLAHPARAAEYMLEVAVIHLPPEVIISPDGESLSGSAVESTRFMASQCRADVKFVVSPAWSRAFRMAVDGTTDGIVPTIESSERSKFLFFPKYPAVRSRMSLITTKSSGYKKFTGYEMLDGKRVGRMAGGLVAPQLDVYLQENEVTVSRQHSYYSLFKSLLAGRVDFVAGNRTVYEFYAEQLGFAEEILPLEPVLHEVPQYLALSRAALANHPERNTLYECLFTAETLEP